MTMRLVDSFVKVAYDSASLNKSAAMAKRAFSLGGAMTGIKNFAQNNPALATSLGTGLVTGLVSKASGGDFLPAAAMGTGAGYLGHKAGVLNIPGIGGGQPTTVSSGTGGPVSVNNVTATGPTGNAVPVRASRTVTGNPMPSITLSTM